MRTEVVEWTGPDWVDGAEDGAQRTVRLTVTRANMLIGMQRTRIRIGGQDAFKLEDALAKEAEEAGGAPVPVTDDDHRILRLYTYPDVCAAVTAAVGLPTAWPPDFESFLAWPDDLDARLEAVIYRLNPHWLPGAESAAAADPKAPAP